jgi:predicted 3-demethylubiquinone-9 3-methyltransferase (glyoxalase superfamily)
MADQKITPCLWFDKNCEEAINFYTSIFPNSEITLIQRYPEEVPEDFMKGMEGKIITAIFELDGYKMMALDGGPIFKPNPSISFFLNFDPKKDKNASENLNKFWVKLVEGGKVLMPLQEYPFSKLYGWLEDKFGVSWQLILSDPEGDDRPFIVPSLLFVNDVAGKAEEAVDFYLSLFKNSKKGLVARYPAGMEPDKEGTVMYSDFMIENQWFAAMDSAHKHEFNFTEGVSLEVKTADQEETDYFWNKLTTEGGEESQCGWLKDKYGVSWQITPARLGELLTDPDKIKADRVMKCMLKQKKIIIKELEDAYNG